MILRLGVTDPQVKVLRGCLQEAGYMLPVDSYPEEFFSREVEAAVEDFQENHVDASGLPLKADGEVGPKTWWALNNDQGSLPPLSEKTIAALAEAAPITDYRELVPANPRFPDIPTRDISKVNMIVIHTADADFSAQQLCEYAISENNHIQAGGCPCPMYSMFIEADGHTYLLNDPGTKSYHVAEFNARSFGISYGRKVTGKPPESYKTPVIEAALITAAHNAALFFGTTDILFHRSLPNTGFADYNKNGVKDPNEPLRKECPGMAWQLETFRSQVHFLMQWTLNTIQGSSFSVDGRLTPNFVSAVAQFSLLAEPRLSLLLGKYPGMKTWADAQKA